MGLTGLIGRVLSFTRVTRNGAKVSDVKFNPGGDPNRTSEHFAPAGDDSHPLGTDYVYTAPAPQHGKQVALGYVDPSNEPKAQEGEKRIYARDSGTGVAIVEVWLKNDGTALVTNDNGSIAVHPDGSFEVDAPLGGSFIVGADGSILGQNPAGSFQLQAGGTFVVNGVTITPAGLITTPNGIVTPSAVVDGVETAGHDHAQANDSGGNTEQDTGPMQ